LLRLDEVVDAADKKETSGLFLKSCSPSTAAIRESVSNHADKEFLHFVESARKIRFGDSDRHSQLDTNAKNCAVLRKIRRARSLDLISNLSQERQIT
jgi:hypothetical protein